MTRLVAFHLPQFHPTPENDAWWGAGFTEWRNVVQARPRFPGHFQPHRPADLGFYDLRLPETREAQAELAARHGIHGFCYYHYWFNGRRILNRPVDEILASGRPGMPFTMCWANENWTRAWDGESREILLGQEYGPDDDLAHIRHLIPAFEDPRWIRVDGKPLFLVYRASLLPDALRTTGIWREEARRAGVGDLHLLRVESFLDEREQSPQALGFDGAVEFQPDWANLPPKSHDSRLWRRLRRHGFFRKAPWSLNKIYDYREFVELQLAKPPAPWDRIPAVTPMWDNSARRKVDASIFHGSTPELYERFLRETIRHRRPRDTRTDLVFVNAWNEWAEGCHLEPCLDWGHSYLEATARALRDGDA